MDGDSPSVGRVVLLDEGLIRRIVQQETEVLRQRIAKLERRLDGREDGR